jgi:hypothetical protein
MSALAKAVFPKAVLAGLRVGGLTSLTERIAVVRSFGSGNRREESLCLQR